MIHDIRTPSRNIPFVSGVCLVCLIAWAPPAQAVTLSSSMTAEELLEYTLTDLKNKMQQTAEYNDQLKAKSESLRNRIFALTQEKERLEKKKQELVAESADVAEYLKVDLVENSSQQERFNDLDRYRDKLRDLNKNMARYVADAQNDTGRLELQIAKAGNEILDLQSQVRAYQAVPDSRAQAQKRQWQDRLAVSSKRIRDYRSEIAGLGERKDSWWTKKQAFVDEQTELKVKIASVNRQIADKDAAREDLAQEAWQLNEKKDQAAAATRSEVEKLRAYRDELSVAWREFSTAVTTITDQARQQQRDMLALKDDLTEKNRLLSKEKELLLKAVERADRLKEVGDDKQGIAATVAKVSEQVAAVRQEQKDLQAGVTVQEEKQREMARQEKQLDAQIKDLANDLERSKRLTESERKKGLKGEELRLSQEVRKQDADNQRLQRQVDALQKKAADYQSRLEGAKAEKKKLSQDLDMLGLGLEQLSAEQDSSRERTESIKSALSGRGQDMEDAVAALKQRRAVLEETLAIAREKLNNDSRRATGQSSGDESRLSDYLEVLKNENRALRAKAAGLKVSLDSFKSLNKDQPAILMDEDGSSNP